MKIIDIHSHLGDILYGEDIIHQKGLSVPVSQAEKIYRKNFRLYLSKIINPNGRFFEKMLTEKSSQLAVKAHVPRNNACTLENAGRYMDSCGVSAMCVLPVHPYVRFDDVLKASKSDPRIIPFTSIDYSLGKDAGKKLLEDARNGARGLKIHPIIQRKSLLDPDTLEALGYWAETGKPVQPHIGVYYYYPGEDRDLQKPEYGRFDDFRDVCDHTQIF